MGPAMPPEGTGDPTVLIPFVLASAVLALSPGPDNIFVLIQSMARGSRAGLAIVMGLVAGCLVHTSLLALGVSQMIKHSDNLYATIKLFGALFLLFLAWKAFGRDGGIHLQGVEDPPGPPNNLFLTGLAMNVLNPKVSIFFLAFFPGFLFSGTLPLWVQFYVLGLLFMATTGIVFGLIALLSGRISGYIIGHPRAGIGLKWLQIGVYLGIAIYLLLSEK